MGNWNITIQGVGPHGNGIKEDAEQLYRKFMEDVHNAGHNITQSSVTYGGAYFDTRTIPPLKSKGEPVGCGCGCGATPCLEEMN